MTCRLARKIQDEKRLICAIEEVPRDAGGDITLPRAGADFHLTYEEPLALSANKICTAVPGKTRSAPVRECLFVDKLQELPGC